MRLWSQIGPAVKTKFGKISFQNTYRIRKLNIIEIPIDWYQFDQKLGCLMPLNCVCRNSKAKILPISNLPELTDYKWIAQGFLERDIHKLFAGWIPSTGINSIANKHHLLWLPGTNASWTKHKRQSYWKACLQDSMSLSAPNTCLSKIIDAHRYLF